MSFLFHSEGGRKQEQEEVKLAAAISGQCEYQPGDGENTHHQGTRYAVTKESVAFIRLPLRELTPVQSVDQVAVRSLSSAAKASNRTDIREDACPQGAPRQPQLLVVSAFLRELILRLTERPVEYDEQGHDGLVVATLLGEINWTPLHPLSLPVLKDSQLRLLEKTFTKSSGDSYTLEDWAARLQCSPRSLARLFTKETGMSFQIWRDQMRTFAALPILAKEKPVL